MNPLKSVREIIESGDHDALQNLFLGEAQRANSDNIFVGEIGEVRPKLNSKVQ